MSTSTTKTLDRSTITSDNTSNKSVWSLTIKEIQCPSKLLYNLPLATKIITMYLDVVMSDRLQCPSLNVDSCGWSEAKHRALIRMMMIMVWLVVPCPGHCIYIMSTVYQQGCSGSSLCSVCNVHVVVTHPAALGLEVTPEI